MSTRYVIQADCITEVNKQDGSEIDGRVMLALSRRTRKGALRAADTLLDALGEGTEVSIAWEFTPDDGDSAGGLFE